MTILADENIVNAQGAFGCIGDVHYFRGAALHRRDIGDSDVLLVRSVTRVDRSLLEGSDVRFVGSATIGTDHVDTDYLREAGITFAYAPGSNADSVAEYVTAALLRLCVRRSRPLRGLRVGIVGCGQIGGRLAERLPYLGVETLLNDPPLAEVLDRQGRMHTFMSLEDVLAEADAVTIHVPLERGGAHPTFHLIGAKELRRMAPETWLINTSRGPVVDNAALKRSLVERDSPAGVVLDVWEGEPEPDGELVARIDIATPHIAGYAYDAKLRGTWMLYRALRRFLGEDELSDPTSSSDIVRTDVPVGAPDPSLPEVEWLELLVRGMYDIGADDAALQRFGGGRRIEGARFAALRREYPMRREFSMHQLPRSSVPSDRHDAVERGLCIRMR